MPEQDWYRAMPQENKFDTETFNPTDVFRTSEAPLAANKLSIAVRLRDQIANCGRSLMAKIQSDDYLIWSTTARYAASFIQVVYLVGLVIAALIVLFKIDSANQLRVLIWFSLLSCSTLYGTRQLRLTLKKEPDRKTSKYLARTQTLLAFSQGILWAYIQTQLMNPVLSVYGLEQHFGNLLVLAMTACVGAIYVPAYMVFAATYTTLSSTFHLYEYGLSLDLLAYLFVGFGLSFFALQLASIYREWLEHKLELEKYCANLEQVISSLRITNVSLTRCMSMAKHDLQQPLYALGVQLVHMARRQLNPEDREVIQRIESTVSSLREGLNNLLDTSRVDDGHLKPQISDFSAQTLLERLDADFRSLAENKGLNFEVVGTALNVRSDAGLLYVVLSNFVSNAIRYTSAGHVIINVGRKGPYLYIEVHDTGIGIARDEITKIFKEFYRSETASANHHAGLGLGLSFVSKIARLLNHPIVVTSTPNRGSRFGVKVPISMLNLEQDEFVPPEYLAPYMQTYQVGLACPDKIHRARWKTLLYSAGTTQLAAEESLEKLLGNNPDWINFDLVIIQGYPPALLSKYAASFAATRAITIWVIPNTQAKEMALSEISNVYMVYGPVTSSRLREIIQKLPI